MLILLHRRYPCAALTKRILRGYLLVDPPLSHLTTQAFAARLLREAALFIGDALATVDVRSLIFEGLLIARTATVI